MEILLTLRQPLVPADTGGKVRSWNIFSRLARGASIDAVSFAEPSREASGIAEMKQVFRSYTPVPWQEAAKHSAGFYTGVLANQLSSLPYSLAKCNRADFRSAVEALAARRRYDVILCDFLHTAVPMLGLAARPKVVFEHNVEFLVRKRKWELEKHPLRRWIFSTEWKRTHAAEARVCRLFDHVISVSKEDQQTLQQEFGIGHVSVLPAGVDTAYFRPVSEPPQPGRLVFVGSMDWDPNEDGVLWFLREVYPRIRQAVPHVSFSIVGRRPSARLRRIAQGSPGVEVTGPVPDVRPSLSAAEVVVVPLRAGGGTRIKIPEAMAMAKPVVSTPIGAEGLPFGKDGELCLAEQPEEFAQAVVALLAQSSLRDGIGAAARRAVVERHSWDSVVERMEEVLEQVTWKQRLQTVPGRELPAPGVSAWPKRA
jgi:glycosyltransferase involved in cell wall biosynthesis